MTKDEMVVAPVERSQSPDLLDAAVPDALKEHGLRHLGAEVGVAGLLGHEHARDLAILDVHLGDLELDLARDHIELLVVLVEELGITLLGKIEFDVHLGDLELDLARDHIELLVVLVEELGITLLAVLKTRERDGHVVAGRHTAALGVKEEAGAVGRHLEVATELGADLEGGAGAAGHELLDGEEERDTLAARKLHGGGGVVNAVLLGELNLAALVGDGAGHAIEGVGLAGHELRLHEVLDDIAVLLGDLQERRERYGVSAKVSRPDVTSSRICIARATSPQPHVKAPGASSAGAPKASSASCALRHPCMPPGHHQDLPLCA
mmetsp:Transcript_23660/g.74427  ORF Transcript_23660/g.74427 Transcript_23660/m.74427 type:complete len:322 (-) Transcript_23660:106-1071(-)